MFCPSELTVLLPNSKEKWELGLIWPVVIVVDFFSLWFAYGLLVFFPLESFVSEFKKFEWLFNFELILHSEQVPFAVEFLLQDSEYTHKLHNKWLSNVNLAPGSCSTFASLYMCRCTEPSSTCNRPVMLTWDIPGTKSNVWEGFYYFSCCVLLWFWYFKLVMS